MLWRQSKFVQNNICYSYLNLGTCINFEAKQCKFTDIYSLENVLPKFRQCAKYNFACQLEKECFHAHEPLSEAYQFSLVVYTHGTS